MRTVVRIILALMVISHARTILSAPLAHFWSTTAGEPDGEATMSLAVVANSGDVVATGYFNGTIDLDGIVLVSGGASDAWLARFNNRGEVKWAKRFGNSFNSLGGGNGVGVDAAGNVYLVGDFENSVDLGGGDLYGTGGVDVFLAKFNPNGAHIWSYALGGVDYDTPTSLAVDGSGNVCITGYFNGTANFGGGAGWNVTSSGSTDVFFVKYTTNGLFQWTGAAGSPLEDAGFGIAVDGTGNVFATGYFQGTMILGGSPLVSAGGRDMYLAKFSPSGSIQFSQRRGGTGDDLPLKIAADASGNVVVTGVFTGTTNLGAGNLSSAGLYDIFLARYSSLGTYQWGYRFGGTGDDVGYAVTMDASSNATFSGAYSAGTNLGGGILANAGSNDVFFARYNSAGQHVWSQGVGGSGDDVSACVGLVGSSNVVVGGYFSSVVNFGGGNHASAGREDLFLARYGPAEPAITSIADVGNDQGRSVRITLSRSGLDDGTAALPISEYRAYRRVLPLPAVAAAGGGALVDPPGIWEFAASVPASNAATYRIIAPTLADSTVAQGMYYSKFFVRAATSNPSVFFDSPVDSGYSLDNLAPGVPGNFSLAAGTLNWDGSSAGDFDYFSVYGSNTADFGTATLIDYTVANTLDVTAAPYLYYFVTATDFSGNEGNPATTSTTTGADGTPKNYVLSISAYPNPFNPSTTVRYTLPARGHVVLAVYDLRGEIVATLVDREHDAGAFTATWNGRDGRGEPASSGVYFARLVAVQGARSYKLVLLK